MYTQDNERKRVQLCSLKSAPAAVFIDYIVEELVKMMRKEREAKKRSARRVGASKE